MLLSMDNSWGTWGGRRRPAGIILALALVALGACAPNAIEPSPPPAETTFFEPTPKSEAPPDSWPDGTNTGVPEGTTLTPWTDDCTISGAGTVIDARTVDCDLRISAPDVRITRSVVNGFIVVVPDPDSENSFSISDSEVRLGNRMITGLGNGNYTAERVEVTGGRRSANCQTDCRIEHSWLHGQSEDPEGKAHIGGIRMGQNTTIRFNTITCDAQPTPPGAACSAGLTGYGDFAPVQNNLIENNIFMGGSMAYCAYGGSSGNDGSKPYGREARDIRFINNVFVKGDTGKCGTFGAIVSFDATRPGNVWQGNVWDDDEPLAVPN